MDNQIDYNKTLQRKSISFPKTKQKINVAKLRKQLYLALALGLLAFWVKVIVVDGKEFFDEFMICTFVVMLLLIFKSLDKRA